MNDAAPVAASDLLAELQAEGLAPEEVVELAAERPIAINGGVYLIARTSCHCGGEWAWMKQRPSGAWEMKGCVCHNSALGI